MTSRNGIRGLFGAPVAAAAILLLASGCSHPDDPAAASASPGPPAKSPAQVQADAIKAVEANPHIPEQAKANIIRQLKGGPPKPIGAPPSAK